MKLARFIKYIAVLRTIIAVVIGITLAVCIIYLVSSEPSSTVKNFFIGPLLNFSRIGNIFESATPLILAGVGTAVAFQAGMIYIGAGGALFLGAAVGTLVAVSTNAPTFIHLLIALLAAMVTIGIHEFITSLMLNYIAAFLGIYIINYFARDTAAALLQSKELPITAWFPRIVPGTRIHVGFILAILMAFLINFFLYNTHWGYEIRMVGKNQEFAKFNGINIERTIVISTSIAGAMAGFAGMSEVMGIFHRFQWSETPGWGFESILIVILARNNPILIIPVALFFAYLKTGAQNAAVLGDIPSEIVVIIISMVIFLATAELFFKNLKQRLSMEKINKDELHY